MSQLINEAFANVNVTLVIALMALGFIVKHVKFLESVNNNIIPPMLLLFSVVAVTVMDGFTVQSIISGIVNAAVAVGLHQQGKNIFSVTVVPSISDLFAKLTNKTNIEFEETTEEFVEEEITEEVDEVVESEDTGI
jgi:hypothetical protein